MPAPSIETTVAGQWTPVAIDVLTGQVHKMETGKYLQTYRPTGVAAPTLESEGVPLFVGVNSEEINSNEPIDVYVWSDAAGSVRVDV